MCSLFLSDSLEQWFPGPSASPPPADMLNKQIMGLSPKSIESQIWEWGNNLCASKVFLWFWCILTFDIQGYSRDVKAATDFFL